MYLIYVDEAGDPGISGSPAPYYVLSGIVVHELRWHDALNQLIAFRRRMQRALGLLMSEEIHAASMINRPGKLMRIARNDRLSILRFFARELAMMNYLSVINVVVDKSGKPADYDVFRNAWRALIQRFSNMLLHRNFPVPRNPDDTGLILSDDTNTKKLVQLLRQMRRYNPIPHQPHFGPGYRNLAITNVVEDPNFRDSRRSYFIQAADTVAFLLYQKLQPSSYIRRKSGHGYFNRLGPILCKVASSTDPQGIVWL